MSEHCQGPLILSNNNSSSVQRKTQVNRSNGCFLPHVYVKSNLMPAGNTFFSQTSRGLISHLVAVTSLAEVRGLADFKFSTTEGSKTLLFSLASL